MAETRGQADNRVYPEDDGVPEAGPPADDPGVPADLDEEEADISRDPVQGVVGGIAGSPTGGLMGGIGGINNQDIAPHPG